MNYKVSDQPLSTKEMLKREIQEAKAALRRTIRKPGFWIFVILTVSVLIGTIRLHIGM